MTVAAACAAYVAVVRQGIGRASKASAPACGDIGSSVAPHLGHLDGSRPSMLCRSSNSLGLRLPVPDQVGVQIPPRRYLVDG